MSEELTNYTPITIYHEERHTILPRETTDDMLVRMWMNDLKQQTQEAYQYDINQFRAFIGVPLQQATLQHVQDYVTHLRTLDLKQNTINRKMKAVKSLLSFARNTGYTQFNVGTLIKVRKAKNNLSARIMSKEQVYGMIALTSQPKYKLILRTLYGGALRVSELCNLQWRDIVKNGESAQIDIYGKDDITRHVLLGEKLSKELLAMKEGKDPETYVFISQKKGPFDPSHVDRIVMDAACRAGVETYPYTQRRTNKKTGVVEEKHIVKSHVSAHWLRHAHASHALDDGASMALVQQTLGHQSIETTAGYTHARPKDSSAFYINV